MLAIIYVMALIGLLYALFALHMIRRQLHSWRYPLPELGPMNGLAGLLLPLYNEISFAIHCWKMPEIDFVAHVYGVIEMISMMFRREGVCRVWVGNHPFVLIFEPHAAEALLSSSDHIEKAESYELLHRWLGTGLLTSAGPKWRARRKLLTPTFHFNILEDFIEIFNRQSQFLARRLQHEFSGGKKILDISNEISLCTLDIICETAMGIQIDAQQASQSAYVQAINTVGETFIKRNTCPWLWPEFIFRLSPDGKVFAKALDVLHSFTRKVINERRASYQADFSPLGREQTDDVGLRKRRAFLDLLIEKHMEAPEALTLADIAEEVDTFMFEGHDTTAVGVSWCLYLLGHNPAWQQKVADEIIDVVGTDPSTPVTSDHLPRLKWLECVIKESQRLYPSVPLIGRRLRQDLIIPMKGIVPAGSTVLLSIIHLHRRSESYYRPEMFMPERFYQRHPNAEAGSNSDLATRHPYGYVPFSAGPRNCIGQRFALMEEKIIVANLLRHLEFRSATPRDSLLISINLVTRACGMLKMCARSRQCTNDTSTRH